MENTFEHQMVVSGWGSAMEAGTQVGRLRKPSWKDPRLFVGILLVLASVAAVVALVGNANKSIPVYMATSELAVGQSLSADSFSVVNVRLGDLDGKYYRPSDLLPTNAVAVRMVPKGELVPVSSVGGTDGLNRKPVSVEVTEALPKELVAGTRVDVWVALPNDLNGYKEPVLMLPGVEVASLSSSQSGFGTGKNTQLMVLVTDAQMPSFLGAVANKAKVSVVWNPGAAK